MPRDLFDQTLVARSGPKRSKWTIAGSIVAHAGLVALLLVVPVLSALDEFVALADELTYVPPVMKAMPAAPPAPSRQAAVTPQQLNRDAAPTSAATKPVTEEPPAGPPGPPDIGSLTARIGVGPGVPGGIGGNDTIRVDAPPAPPTPTPAVPRRAGGDIQYPARTYYVEPVYSGIARAAGLEGYVILEATIDESGIVRNVTVLRSQSPMLTPSAVEAVSKWRYTPTKLNGVAIPVILTVTVNFSLR